MTNDERRTTKAGRAVLVRRRAAVAGLLCAMALLLSGCMLASGEQSTSDTRPTGGNLSASFVSAEGTAVRTLPTGAGATTMNVIVIVSVQQGELRIEMLDSQGAVALALDGRPDESVTRSANIPTDDQGNLRYRVVARGARNGSYQLLYQPSGQS